MTLSQVPKREQKEHFLSTIALILLLLALFGYIYRNLLGAGMLTFGDLVAFPSHGSAWIQQFLSSWYPEGLGRNESMNPQFFFMGGLISILGGNMVLAQKLIFLLLMPAASVTMYLCLRHLVESRLARSVASLVYAINPLTTSAFWCGSLSLLFIYACFPLLFLFSLNMLDGRRPISNGLLFTFFLVVASTLNPEAALLFAPILPGLLATKLLTERNVKHISKVILLLIMSLAVTFLTLLPVAMGQFGLGATAFRSGEVGLELLLNELKSQFDNFTLIDIWGYLSFALPVFAFSASLLVKDKNRRARVLGLSLVGVLIILFLWLTHMGLTADLLVKFSPLFSYRYHDRLMYALSLVFCILAAYTIDEVQKRLKHFSLGPIKNANKTSCLFRNLALAVLCAALVIPTISESPRVPYGSKWEVFSGDMGISKRANVGDWPSKEIPPWFYQVGDWLDNRRQEEGDFRTLWLPQDFQTNVVLRAVDPHTLIAPWAAEPRGFPNLDYIKGIIELLSQGDINNIGLTLGTANVKYIIVNRASPQTGEARTSYANYTYYALGDPKNFAQILDRQKDLKLVVEEQEFLIYENTAYSPHVSVYDKMFLIAPQSNVIGSNNLLLNPNFRNGLSNWVQLIEGQFTVDKEIYPSSYSIRTEWAQPNSWSSATQTISVKENTDYYVSVWIKTQNVRQTHFKLQYLDSKGESLGYFQPHIPIDGTRDWWHVSALVVLPPGTVNVRLFCNGGWSYDGVNPGITWFRDIEFVRYPVPSALELLSYVPGFNPEQQLLLEGDLLSSSEAVDRFLAVSDAVIFFGDPIASDGNGKWASESEALLSVYEAETSLVPKSGYWRDWQDSSLSQGHAIECSGEGEAVQSFIAPRAGYYSVSIRANWEVAPKIDGKVLNLIEPKGEGGFKQYETIPIYLESGEHVLSVDHSVDLIGELTDGDKKSSIPLPENNDFEVGDPPAEWVPSSCALSQEATIIKTGSKSLKLVANGPWATGYQLIADYGRYIGREVTFGAWCYASVDNDKDQTLQIYDGVGTTRSTIIPKDNDWHWVTVTRLIDISANQIRIGFVANDSATSDTNDLLYVDGAILFSPVETVHTAIDQILIFSTKHEGVTLGDLFHSNQSLSFHSAEISTTEYNISVESSAPVFVVLGESFHPDWNARVDGEKLEHLVAFEWANGFYLNKSGESLVKITFDQQKSRNIILIVWSIIWIALLLAITYAFRKGIVSSYRAIKALVANGLGKVYHRRRRGGSAD